MFVVRELQEQQMVDLEYQEHQEHQESVIVLQLHLLEGPRRIELLSLTQALVLVSL